MPYAINPVDGVRSFYESFGEGPPLMLYHGWGRSSEHWHEYGFVDAFKSSYQVILIDSRAHGKSDGPHNPDSYAMELLVGDILAVLDELGVEKTSYLGHSSGGWYGYGLIKHAPERVQKMVVCAYHPFKESDEFYEKAAAQYAGGMDAFVIAREEVEGKRQPEPDRTRSLGQDAKALEAMLLGIKAGQGVDVGLDSTTIPIMLIAGSEDHKLGGIERAAKLIPNSEFHTLAGIDHSGSGQRVDLIEPLVTDFLSRRGLDP